MKLRIVVMLCLSAGVAWAAEVTPPVPAAASSASKATTPAAAPKATSAKPSEPTKPANDQLILDSTVVTGNRELPKVMYIVPWKKAELNNLPGQPFNTLVDEVLAPVDREVFRREVEYYQVISEKDRADKDKAATPANDRK